jgi:hypothetical protein
MIGYGNSVFLRTAWEVSGGVPPVNTVAPAITGTAQEGQTVTCSTGTWTGTPTITFAYQWKRNGSNIGSATNSTYTLVTADVSQSITCQVTATNGSGSASATSNTITPIAAVDPDAQAFITAAGITNPTQQGAINTLVVDLKGYSIWTKFKAIYPIVGGTASQHKYNLKDPRDLDAAFRLTFATGWTHSATGMQGTNTYANSNLNVSTNLSQNSTHISVYIRTNNVSNAAAISASRATAPILNLFPDFSGLSYFRVNSDNLGAGFSTGGSHLGLWVANRISSSEIRNYRNTTRYINPVTSTGLRNTNVWLGSTPDFADYYINQYAFASIGDGLTDTDAANFYTAVNAYQVALSRNV